MELFVASRTKDGDEVGNCGVWVDIIRKEVCRIAGGCTAVAGIGSWVNPDTGGPVNEHTTVIRAHVSRARLLDGLPLLRQVLVQYGRECEQHTVAFALDGEFFGLDPSVEY